MSPRGLVRNVPRSPAREVLLKRTAMSSRELERVEVMGRVASGDLKLSDAAVMLELSYRQTKRLWRRYVQVGRKGLKHGNAGRPSNRSQPLKLGRRVLNLALVKKIVSVVSKLKCPDFLARDLSGLS